MIKSCRRSFSVNSIFNVVLQFSSFIHLTISVSGDGNQRSSRSGGRDGRTLRKRRKTPRKTLPPPARSGAAGKRRRRRRRGERRGTPPTKMAPSTTQGLHILL